MVRFAFKDDVSAADRQRVADGMRRIGAEVPAVQSCAVGRDVGADFDMSAQFVLKDVAGFRELLAAPALHEGEQFARPLIEREVGFDLVDDADPAVADELAAIYAELFGSV
ncbi:Dabb family protein [Kribbella sp. NBC_01505]|uniref:Dabb family protein n=1 Tax=Kribbella sp. NBC_01505 TaxID=2903580 RepID=UPI003868E5D0